MRSIVLIMVVVATLAVIGWLGLEANRVVTGFAEGVKNAREVQVR